MQRDPPFPTSPPHPPDVPDMRDVMSIVRRTERIEGLVPRAIMTLFVGTPLVSGVLHGHVLLGLINAFLLSFVGGLLCRAVALLILGPLHRRRYGKVARRLAAALEMRAPDARYRMRWTDGLPGALAITRALTVLLVDRSTGYRIADLACDAIVALDRRVDEDFRLTHRHRPAWTLAIPVGRGLFTAWTFGGRTVTTGQVARSHSILLRYQSGQDPEIRCAVIPFGADEIGAEHLRLALLQGQAAG